MPGRGKKRGREEGELEMKKMVLKCTYKSETVYSLFLIKRIRTIEAINKKKGKNMDEQSRSKGDIGSGVLVKRRMSDHSSCANAAPPRKSTGGDKVDPAGLKKKEQRSRGPFLVQKQ